MADSKISALSAATAATLAQESPVNDGGTTKKISNQQVMDLLGVFKGRVSADHTISATTATKCTLSPNPTGLAAGTYDLTLKLLLQTATTTVSPMIGLNYTGTVTKLRAHARYVDTAVATGAGTGAMAATSTSGSPENVDALAISAVSTTAPNIGITVPATAIGSTATDVLMIIEGILVVSTSGDFELWHGSETATSTSVMANSTFMIARVA